MERDTADRIGLHLNAVPQCVLPPAPHLQLLAGREGGRQGAGSAVPPGQTTGTAVQEQSGDTETKRSEVGAKEPCHRVALV